MNCKKCGNLLDANDMFCKKCGEPVSIASAPITPEPTVAPTNVSPNNDLNQMATPPVNNEPNEMASSMPETAVPPIPEVPSDNMNQPVQPVNETVTNNLNQMVQPTNPTPEQPQLVNQTPVAPTPSESKPKANNKLKIIIIVLALVIVAVGGFIVYKMLKPGSETPATVDPSGGGSEVINNGGNTGNTYNHNGFQFTLPTGYTASAYNDEFIIKSATAVAQIKIVDYYTLDDIKPEAETLKAEFTKQGMTVTTIENKTYGGKEWLLMPATMTENGVTYNLTIAFTDLGEYHVTRQYIVTREPNDESIYTQIVNMFATATYNGTTSFSNDGEKGELNVSTTPNESIFNNES